MLEDHGRRRQALGARGSHVILLQHIQHAGAGETDDQRRVRDSESDRRHDQIGEAFQSGRVGAERSPQGDAARPLRRFP